MRQFRQILLWPLQLMPRERDAQTGDCDFPAALASGADSSWVEISEEFPNNPSMLDEHAYREFVSFLPHVQRFLYGLRARPRP